MALIDTAAAQHLKELRQARGHSPESLAIELRELAKASPWGERGTVDAYTIRQIEKHSHVPGPRVAFVLAAYHGLLPHEIWKPGRQVERELVTA